VSDAAGSSWSRVTGGTALYCSGAPASKAGAGFGNGVLSAAAPAPDWRLPTDCAGLLPPLVVPQSRRRLPHTA